MGSRPLARRKPCARDVERPGRAGRDRRDLRPRDWRADALWSSTTAIAAGRSSTAWRSRPTARRAWASGGGQNVVHAYDVLGRAAAPRPATIPAPGFPAGHRLRAHAARRPPVRRQQPRRASPDGVRDPPGHTVTVIDPATGHDHVATIDLGAPLDPLGVTFDRDGTKAYVTNWIGRSVSVIDTATQTEDRRRSSSRRTERPAAGRPPDGDRGQPGPRRGLHGQREQRHGLRDRPRSDKLGRDDRRRARRQARPRARCRTASR